MAQLGQRYQPYAQQIDQWLAQQQASRGQPQRPRAPEWNPAWRQMVRRNEQGQLVPVGDAPADLPQKYQTAQQHQLEMLDKLAFGGPKAAFGDELQQMIRAEAQAIVQEHLTGYQDRTYAGGVVQENAPWLYQKDGQGNIQTNPLTGQRVFTREGALYFRNVQNLEAQGIRDVRVQDALARQLTIGQLLQEREQGAAAQQTNEQLKQQALNGGGRQPNFGGTLLPGTNPNNPPPPQNGQIDLREMLRQNLRAAGVTDADFAGAR
jgi:hypothetical protein